MDGGLAKPLYYYVHARLLWHLYFSGLYQLGKSKAYYLKILLDGTMVTMGMNV